MTDQGPAIELPDGEEGVAPGQACVLYDAGTGPARVLGGGFIRRLADPAAAMRQDSAASLAAP
jgi:tRNA-specific 2-thiouridylase